MTLPLNRNSLHSRRTPRMIGRQEYTNAIRDAIADRAHNYVFQIVGPGGTGKTRLIEDVEFIRAEWKNKPFLLAKLIDFYHDDYHSSINLFQAIADRLDPQREYFRAYRVARQRFEKLYQAGIAGPQLDEALAEVGDYFSQEYTALAKRNRIVLCFDTLEKTQHEIETVQRRFGIEDLDIGIKSWFMKQATALPNTVMLLAGRPRPALEEELKACFTRANWVCTRIDIDRFVSAQINEYIDAKLARNTGPALNLEPSERKWIMDHSEGLPIRLELAILLLSNFHAALPSSGDLPDRFLVEELRTLKGREGEVFQYLLLARKGLNAPLLEYLTGWSPAEAKSTLKAMRDIAIVKGHEEITSGKAQGDGSSIELFLHDELYDIWDRYHNQDLQSRQDYKRIAEYYRHKLDKAHVDKREALMIPSLYYESQANPVNGYHCYYSYLAQWDEENPKSFQSTFGRRLTDEALQFADRYTDPTNDEFYDRDLADSSINRATFERAYAVHAINRYILRSEYTKARDLAEKLYTNSEPDLDWKKLDDPLYKTSLLAALGEARTYTGAPERDARNVLEQALQLLEKGAGEK